MASLTTFCQSHSLFKKPYFAITSLSSSSWLIPKDFPCTKAQCCKLPPIITRRNVVVSGTAMDKPRKRYPGETKGFVEGMRFVAMKFHSTEQSKEGEKEVKELEDRSLEKWEPISPALISPGSDLPALSLPFPLLLIAQR